MFLRRMHPAPLFLWGRSGERSAAGTDCILLVDSRVADIGGLLGEPAKRTQVVLNRSRAGLTTIGQALAPQGDILVHGCDVGAGATGQWFVDTLATATTRRLACRSPPPATGAGTAAATQRRTEAVVG